MAGSVGIGAWSYYVVRAKRIKTNRKLRSFQIKLNQDIPNLQPLHCRLMQSLFSTAFKKKGWFSKLENPPLRSQQHVGRTAGRVLSFYQTKARGERVKNYDKSR